VGEFGDKFRKAREKKELSLDDVSNVTKISARMLQAIEEEHFDQLPGGVFNKGFIRAYSKHLGLNDEDAVNDYLACLRQAQIDAHEVWEPERPRTTPPKPQPSAPQIQKIRPIEPKAAPVKPQPPVVVEELPELHLPRAEDVHPRRKDFADKSTFEVPFGILAVAVVIVVLVGILWMRHSRSGNSAGTSSSPVNTVQASTQEKPVPEKAVPEKTASEKTVPEKTVPQKLAQKTSAPPVAMAAPATRPSSAPPAKVTSAPASTTSPQPPPAPPATTPPSAANATSDKHNDKSNAANNSDVTVRTFPKSSAKPSATAAPTLKLVISAKETSWISVLADGQLVSQETLIAPAHASVHASREIVARIGNAAGVTFLWNGREIPADGAESEVKTFVFDSSGMHAVPTPPAP
jgi:cytoskeletal protein RodZ